MPFFDNHDVTHLAQEQRSPGSVAEMEEQKALTAPARVVRFFKVIASKASAKRGSSAGHHARIHCTRGPKQVLTTRSHRFFPFLSSAL